MNWPFGGAKPIGRPRGEVRKALAEWARRWAEDGKLGGASIAELAAAVPGMSAKAPADMRLVRQTVAAMLRAGELVVVGRLSRPGKRGKPPVLYAPKQLADVADGVQVSALLVAALGAWGSPVMTAPDDVDTVE